MMTNTHESYARHQPRDPLAAGCCPERAPWRPRRARRGHSIHIRHVAELDEDWREERIEFERQGIRSLVAVPMMEGGRLRGFVGFDSVRRDRTWDDDTIRMLRTVVGILASLLARCEAQREAQVHEARYRALVQHASDTIVLLDRDGRLLFTAGRSEPLGFLPGDMVGMQAMDFPDPHRADPLDGFSRAGRRLSGRALRRQ